MKIEFIGQGFNLEINTSLAEELIRAFESDKFSSFKCLVAFASYGGVSALTPYILSSKGYFESCKVIVGIDNNGTSKEALEEFLAWGTDVYIFHVTSRSIFHPKIYIFTGEVEHLVFIGSNNLTEFGLVKNIEGAVKIKLSQNDEDDVTFMKEIENYFLSLFQGTDLNLKKLTIELFNTLTETGEIPSEKERSKRHDKPDIQTEDKNENKSENKLSIKKVFSNRQLQKNPKGFKPKRKRGNKLKKEKEEDTSDEEINKIVDNVFHEVGEWSLTTEDDVLVAEIGRGKRWTQISFRKSDFEDFFEVPVKVNVEHFVYLRYLSEQGEIDEETEKVKALVKESSNYNLEPQKVSESSKVPYNYVNKPIILFIKISELKYIYHFQIHGSKIYSELSSFLGEKDRGKIRRKKGKLNDILNSCPSLKIKQSDG